MHAFAVLKDAPRGSEILLRTPRNGPPARFEANVAEMATQLGLQVTWCPPEPGGREQNYLRDFEMVTGADRVEAFFDWEHPMEGGTAHLVEAAMMRGTPVFAWIILPGGQMDRLGELEPYLTQI